LGLADPDVMRNQVAFHAQQAAEKSLKSVLVEYSVRFPKTHDLEALVEMAQLAGISLPDSVQVESLTPFAVETRYPGIFSQVSTAEAESAILTAEAVFGWAGGLVR
jgi:HEPN domain-containing protein